MKKCEETKLTITNAFEELLETKNIERITICDVMKQCNLTRQTFYKHFLDIYDLIIWMYKYNARKSYEAFMKNKDIKECFVLTLTEMRGHITFYKNAIKLKGPNSFIDSYFMLQSNYSKEHIGSNRLDFNLLLQIELFWHGVAGIIVNWIEQDMKINPEIMASNIFKSLPADIKKFYE